MVALPNRSFSLSREAQYFDLAPFQALELVLEVSNVLHLLVACDREPAKEENANIEEPTRLRLSLPQQLTSVTPQRPNTAAAATASPSDAANVLNNDPKSQNTDKTSTMH